jgi:hypothetical protein
MFIALTTSRIACPTIDLPIANISEHVRIFTPWASLYNAAVT